MESEDKLRLADLRGSVFSWLWKRDEEIRRWSGRADLNCREARLRLAPLAGNSRGNCFAVAERLGRFVGRQFFPAFAKLLGEIENGIGRDGQI